MNEKNELIREVLADQTFVKSLLEAENVEAVQKMLADKGVEMSLTEIEILGEALEGVSNGSITQEQIEKMVNGGELSEDELEAAAGGNIITDLFTRARVYELNGTRIPCPTDRVVSIPKIGIAIAAVAGIGYGIYDAVRRRW